MTQIDPQLLADFQAFQAFQAMNAQESGVIVEADEPKKSPAKKRTTTAKRTTAKRTTTAKKSPAKPPVGCLTMGDVWTILGADPEFEPNAEKFDVPAYGNWLARANHLGLLAPAQ